MIRGVFLQGGLKAEMGGTYVCESHQYLEERHLRQETEKSPEVLTWLLWYKKPSPRELAWQRTRREPVTWDALGHADLRPRQEL